MPDYGGMIAIVAECYDCGKVWQTRNAHGVAVQHARKYGHNTAVEVIYNYQYNAPERDGKGNVIEAEEEA